MSPAPGCRQIVLRILCSCRVIALTNAFTIFECLGGAPLFLHSRAGFEIPTKSVLKDSSIRPRNLSACSRRNESPASSTEAERSLKIQRKPTTRAKIFRPRSRFQPSQAQILIDI
jgi:hypothetical protein